MKNTKTSAKHSKPKEKRSLFGQRRRAEELPGAQPQAHPDGPQAKKDASRHDVPRRGGWQEGGCGLSTGEMKTRYGHIYVDMDDKGNGTCARRKKLSYD